jgi:septum formation protein
MRVVLASASPRRREILDRIGIKYDVCVSDCDEHCIEKDPKKLVQILSERKAMAVLKALESGKSGLDVSPETETFCVIGCDTIVYQEKLNGILGKPHTEGEAFEMLSQLAGGVHEVYSGVTILVSGLKTPVKRSFWERTAVHFSEMTDEEIMEYIGTGDPMDKAGAYGIQGFCARYIEGIEGDYLNVVGLPASHLYKELKSLGVV